MAEQKTLPISPYAIPGIVNIELTKTHTMDKIEGVVCAYFKVSKEMLHLKCRELEVVEPRQIAMYLMRNGVKHCYYQRIATYLGFRNHTSVGHTMEKVKNMIETEPEYKNQVNEIIAILETK